MAVQLLLACLFFMILGALAVYLLDWKIFSKWARNWSASHCDLVKISLCSSPFWLVNPESGNLDPFVHWSTASGFLIPSEVCMGSTNPLAIGLGRYVKSMCCAGFAPIENKHCTLWLMATTTLIKTKSNSKLISVYWCYVVIKNRKRRSYTH